MEKSSQKSKISPIIIKKEVVDAPISSTFIKTALIRALLSDFQVVFTVENSNEETRADAI